MGTRGRRLAWLLAVALVPAPSAAAQGLAPQVDRDSPAGAEYELPVERARNQASGGDRGSSGAAQRAPLFGEGVTPKPRVPRASPGTRGRATRPARRPPASTGAPPAVRAQASAPDTTIGGLLVVGAGGAAVLLVGGLAGLGWRRRGHRG